MLTEKAKDAPAATTTSHGAPASTDDLVAYFQGDYVPLRDANVSIMTHAFMYGTAVFEGIRAYWNADQGVLYGLKLREHMERIRRNAGMLLMTDLPPVDELVHIVVETIRRNQFEQDAYVRPCFYLSGKSIGVRLHGLPHELTVLAVPFGNYVDTEKGIRIMTSTWRRNADDALPARGKIVGGYVNMAFQKSEAELNGFEEALVLTADGHASEASAANMFVVRDGVLLTPPVNDDILEGVTRRAILELASIFGIPVETRSIDRSEIYVADEMFLCGTGVQLSPVIELDHRPIAGGAIGPITRQLHEAYFAAVRGNDERFMHWLTAIPSR
ncbi:MAG: branched-chain amino acid aminotransferase [Chloroflexota bacterium]|jgi:branched-chain amino acid aminotransferase|nr:branched-chain amino acid aminotransferase [Chloroflexota bacterium]